MSPGKPASVSRVEAIHIVMPSDANVHGNAFGGIVMQWTDLAGAMAALRHAPHASDQQPSPRS